MDLRTNNVKSEYIVQFRTGQSILNVVQRAHTPPLKRGFKIKNVDMHKKSRPFDSDRRLWN